MVKMIDFIAFTVTSCVFYSMEAYFVTKALYEHPVFVLTRFLLNSIPAVRHNIGVSALEQGQCFFNVETMEFLALARL